MKKKIIWVMAASLFLVPVYLLWSRATGEFGKVWQWVTIIGLFLWGDLLVGIGITLTWDGTPYHELPQEKPKRQPKKQSDTDLKVAKGLLYVGTFPLSWILTVQKWKREAKKNRRRNYYFWF